MVRVSKKYLEDKLKRESWRRLLNEVQKSKSEEELIKSVEKFLTSAEITMLEKRLAIPILLKRGLSYRAIGEVIDVSPNTISFVKHNLTKKPVVHRKYSPTRHSGRRQPDPKKYILPHGKLVYPQRRDRIR